jgi:hypothetical protein
MTLISEFKKLVSPDVLPCPDPIVNREVVSTLLEFCKKTYQLTREFELDIDTDDIDSDLQDSIDLDISEHADNLRPVALVELMVDTTEYIPHKRDIRTTVTNFSSLKDDNYKYYWIPENYLIRLFDMGTANEKIWMKLALKPLRSATEVDDHIFEDWSEAIVAGAKFKLLSMPGKDWSDSEGARYYRSEWRKYLSQAKKATLKGGTAYAEGVNWKSFGDID